MSCHRPHVIITRGLRGYFAVLVAWNPDYGGFWEPQYSGVGSYETEEACVPEAQGMAEAEGVEFVRLQPEDIPVDNVTGK